MHGAHRAVTVTGGAVTRPRNLWVPIGTPLRCLLDACGGLPGAHRSTSCRFSRFRAWATVSTRGIWDLSACVTGLLLALSLPASAPYWVPVMGAAFAIIVVKQFYGTVPR